MLYINTKAFGQFIRSIRLKREFGLREFSELIDMLPSRYSEIECGKALPTQLELDQISDGLGMKKESEIRNDY